MKAAKKTKLRGMKSRHLSIRVDDKYDDVVEFLKLQDGGLSAFVERALERVHLNEEQLKALNAYRAARQRVAR